MKQRFLLSLVFVCAFMVTTRAQISKGSVWLGGSIGYNHQKYGTDTPYTKTNNVNISPAVGLVVKDNLIVGISLTYGHGKTTNNDSEKERKTNYYGGGIFVRQYLPIVSRLYLFGEAGANYEYSKYSSTYVYPQNGTGQYTSKTSTGSLNVTPGLSFAVTKKFLLETSLNNLLGVAYMKGETTSSSTGNKPTVTKNEQFTAGLSSGDKTTFNVGFRFLL